MNAKQALQGTSGMGESGSLLVLWFIPPKKTTETLEYVRINRQISKNQPKACNTLRSAFSKKNGWISLRPEHMCLWTHLPASWQPWKPAACLPQKLWNQQPSRHQREQTGALLTKSIPGAMLPFELSRLLPPSETLSLYDFGELPLWEKSYHQGICWKQSQKIVSATQLCKSVIPVGQTRAWTNLLKDLGNKMPRGSFEKCLYTLVCLERHTHVGLCACPGKFYGGP